MINQPETKFKKRFVATIAILCITLLEVVALAMGVNGVSFGTAIGGVCLITGKYILGGK